MQRRAAKKEMPTKLPNGKNLGYVTPSKCSLAHELAQFCQQNSRNACRYEINQQVPVAYKCWRRTFLGIAPAKPHVNICTYNSSSSSSPCPKICFDGKANLDFISLNNFLVWPMDDGKQNLYEYEIDDGQTKENFLLRVVRNRIAEEARQMVQWKKSSRE